MEMKLITGRSKHKALRFCDKYEKQYIKEYLRRKKEYKAKLQAQIDEILKDPIFY